MDTKMVDSAVLVWPTFPVLWARKWGSESISYTFENLTLISFFIQILC